MWLLPEKAYKTVTLDKNTDNVFSLVELFEDNVKSESNFCKLSFCEDNCRPLRRYVLSLQQLSGRVHLQGQTSELSNYTGVIIPLSPPQQ